MVLPPPAALHVRGDVVPSKAYATLIERKAMYCGALPTRKHRLLSTSPDDC